MLCARCNRALPSFITPEWLRAAANYLGARSHGRYRSGVKESRCPQEVVARGSPDAGARRPGGPRAAHPAPGLSGALALHRRDRSPAPLRAHGIRAQRRDRDRTGRSRAPSRAARHGEDCACQPRTLSPASCGPTTPALVKHALYQAFGDQGRPVLGLGGPIHRRRPGTRGSPARASLCSGSPMTAGIRCRC